MIFILNCSWVFEKPIFAFSVYMWLRQWQKPKKFDANSFLSPHPDFWSFAAPLSSKYTFAILSLCHCYYVYYYFYYYYDPMLLFILSVFGWIYFCSRQFSRINATWLCNGWSVFGFDCRWRCCRCLRSFALSPSSYTEKYAFLSFKRIFRIHFYLIFNWYIVFAYTPRELKHSHSHIGSIRPKKRRLFFIIMRLFNVNYIVLNGEDGRNNFVANLFFPFFALLFRTDRLPPIKSP